MAHIQRYAVYFVPSAESAITRPVSSLLGRDMETATSATQPCLDGCALKRLREITAEPRRYGLHATLKAPFQLAAGYGEAEILASAESFASLHAPFTVNSLRIKRISSFLALVPKTGAEDDGSIPKLKDLAKSALEYFDPLRQRPTSEEIARRKSRSLSPRQLEYLLKWGYPYVLDDYKFHLTLTGRMRDREEAEKVKGIFKQYLADSLQAPLKIDSVCICRQTISEHEACDFELLRRFFLQRK